jgi:hypothetical protein
MPSPRVNASMNWITASSCMIAAALVLSPDRLRNWRVPSLCASASFPQAAARASSCSSSNSLKNSERPCCVDGDSDVINHTPVLPWRTARAVVRTAKAPSPPCSNSSETGPAGIMSVSLVQQRPRKVIERQNSLFPISFPFEFLGSSVVDLFWTSRRFIGGPTGVKLGTGKSLFPLGMDPHLVSPVALNGRKRPAVDDILSTCDGGGAGGS